MWGWASQRQAGAEASQPGQRAFCWDSQAVWGASQAPAAAPAAPPLPRAAAPSLPPVTAVPAPLAVVPPPSHSRSGVAALAAQRAERQLGGPPPDPFAFEEAPLLVPPPPQHPAPAPPLAAPAQQGGWRGRSNSFLLGGSSLAPTASVAPSKKQAQAQRPQAQQQPVAARPAAMAGCPSAPAPAAPAAAPAAATKPSGVPPPPVCCTLSLDRYLEFWQMLTKGSGRVQPLSELERSVLKAADLKQILLANGLNATSRTKKEMLDRLPQLPLFSPLCLAPEPGGASAGGGGGGAAMHSGPQPQVLPVDPDAMAALGWLEPCSAAAATSMGGGSCCALPPVRIQLPPGMLVPAAGTAPVPTQAAACQPPAPVIPLQGPAAPAAAAAAAALTPLQPADSQATVASAGAAAQGQRALQRSPEVGQPQPPLQVAAEDEVAEEEEGMGPPDWLVNGIAAVAERSQGSRDAADGRQLLGRRVAFVLLEDFEQDDPQGITDALEAGVQKGQVVEAVGVDHDEDCPPGCAQRHAFFYVRVRASRSTAPPARQAGRRLDLVVDLQQALRQPELDCLLALADEELQDAWVLLEPRQEAEEEQPAAQQQQQHGGGGWRTKRGAQAAAVAPAAKRR